MSSKAVVVFGFLCCKVGLHVLAVCMIVSECRMHLCQVQVADAVADLFRRQTKLVPPDHALNRNTRAGDARPVLPDVRRGYNQFSDVNL